MTHSLIDDLSTLTTIPITTLKRLAKESDYIICDCIEEAKLQENKLTDIDIGIGHIKVSLDGDRVAYRFIPTKSLSDAVSKTIVDGKNPLTEMAESNWVSKIIYTYKDIIQEI